jgi:hypothetical protein
VSNKPISLLRTEAERVLLLTIASNIVSGMLAYPDANGMLIPEALANEAIHLAELLVERVDKGPLDESKSKPVQLPPRDPGEKPHKRTP